MERQHQLNAMEEKDGSKDKFVQKFQNIFLDGEYLAESLNMKRRCSIDIRPTVLSPSAVPSEAAYPTRYTSSGAQPNLQAAAPRVPCRNSTTTSPKSGASRGKPGSGQYSHAAQS